MIEVCLILCPQWAQNESDGEQNMNTERGFRCRRPSSSTQRRVLTEILCLKVITGSRSNRLLFQTQTHFPVLRSGRRTGGVMRLVLQQLHAGVDVNGSWQAGCGSSGVAVQLRE